MLRSKGGGNQSWRTPDWLFNWISNEYGLFVLDAAASVENTKCLRFYDEQTNGLTHLWEPATFCNPPWGNIWPWVWKAIIEAQCGVPSVLLLPSLWKSSKTFRQVYGQYRDLFGIVELLPRIAYVGQGRSPNGTSMLLTFGYDNAGTISLVDLTDQCSKSKNSQVVTPKQPAQIVAPVHYSKTVNISPLPYQTKSKKAVVL